MSAERSEYKPNDQVVMTEFDGEAVLLNVASGVYYGLDEVGTAVWRLLGEGKPADEIVRLLLERYDVEESRLQADVQRLLADLSREQLVETTDAIGRDRGHRP